MAQKYPLKITVIRKFDLDDLDDYTHACGAVEEGQEFIVQKDGKMPEGFCYWAWHDLWPVMMTLRFGGDLTYCKEGHRMYSSCTDGLSPVVFRVERIEE
jgi:uncharacterized repeat protein (TIGR04076 family)